MRAFISSLNGPLILAVPGSMSLKRQSENSPPTTQKRFAMACSSIPRLFRRDAQFRLELRSLGGFRKCNGRCRAPGDGAGDRVEIAGADLARVARRGVARSRARELGLLQLRVSRHAAFAIIGSEFEHRMVEAVEPR